MSKKLTYDRLTAGDFNRMPCFLAGTLINTEKGLMVIENIKSGDKVWSYNLKTDSLELEDVLETYVNKAEAYLVLETEYGEKLQVTGTHRFWIPIDKRWKSASELSLGDYLFDAKTQTSINIKRIEKIERDVKTFNLNVNKNHNYTIGEHHILTHNKTKSSKLHRKSTFEIYSLYKKFENDYFFIGLTTQEEESRMSQHIFEGKRAQNINEKINILKKEAMLDAVNIIEFDNNNNVKHIQFSTGYDGLEMTYMEALILQQYFVNHYRNILKGEGKGHLFVNSDIINEKQFNRCLESGIENICRFFN